MANSFVHADLSSQRDSHHALSRRVYLSRKAENQSITARQAELEEDVSGKKINAASDRCFLSEKSFFCTFCRQSGELAVHLSNISGSYCVSSSVVSSFIHVHAKDDSSYSC